MDFGVIRKEQVAEWLRRDVLSLMVSIQARFWAITDRELDEIPSAIIRLVAAIRAPWGQAGPVGLFTGNTRAFAGTVITLEDLNPRGNLFAILHRTAGWNQLQEWLGPSEFLSQETSAERFMELMANRVFLAETLVALAASEAPSPRECFYWTGARAQSFRAFLSHRPTYRMPVPV